MYDDLLIGLRSHAKREGCDDRCPCYDAGNRGYFTCSEELAEKAADAIEELSQAKEELAKQIAYWQAQLTQAMCGETLADLDKPRWISVEERLPEEEGDYLAYVCLDDNEPFVGVLPFDANASAFGYWEEYYDPVTYGYAGSDFIEVRGITHWMPLPEPPKEMEP